MIAPSMQAIEELSLRIGYNVNIVQNPTISLADDVAVTKRVLATHSGPVILVGHSYGGAVITEAGNDPKVAGLVGAFIVSFLSTPSPLLTRARWT
jgi:pimeloyl-ACP methyl ester carboxylesterase